ncbi:MAG: hypothetical protein MUE40_05185 [Anaerolineae bacterium]|jgi:hypothetical protein|nr:hypothetical protein [Anaerolineae bacterium]
MVLSAPVIYFAALVSSGLFMVAALATLLVLSWLRQTALRQQEARLSVQPRLEAAALRAWLHLVASPLDALTPWHVRMDETSTGLPVYTTAGLIPGPVIMPLRPQESLLYADTLTQPAARAPEFPLSA